MILFFSENKEMLKGKHIILGITGSIAAYKAAYLIRALVKKGAEVQVVITPAGKEFITPLTLATLSSHPVISEFFSLWADAMLIAPATASTIGKMANGIADNMLVTTYLSCKAPVFVAPAMDLDMFAHPSTQQNLARLRSFGNRIIEPASGELASHLVGKGRMEEPDKIVSVLEDFFVEAALLKNKKILITAGPTYEKIDPVRFIGNYSSGKMGYAVAEACAERGAEVTLVSGPVSLSTKHPGIRVVRVESAAEMYEAATKAFPSMDAAILSAAVADYRPETASDTKIKREATGEMTLHLVPNPDIAASLGAMKKPGQILVGFALETDHGIQHAEEKLQRKHLDFIVLNSLQDAGAGFQYDTNKISIIDRHERVDYPLKTKQNVAIDIVNRLAVCW